MSKPRGLLTPGDVSGLTGHSLRTVLDWICSGALPASSSHDGRMLVAVEDLRRFMKTIGKPGSSARLKPCRSHDVLIFSDDDKLLGRIVRCLAREDLDCGIEIVRECPNVLTMVQTLRPLLVILDVTPPAHDELRLLQSIRASSRIADTKMLVLVRDADMATPEAMMDAGANDWMATPVNAKILVKTVRRLLAETSSEAEFTCSNGASEKTGK